MEFEEKDEQTLDLFVLLADFFRELRRLWVLGVALILALVMLLGLIAGFIPTRASAAKSSELWAQLEVLNEKALKAKKRQQEAKAHQRNVRMGKKK